MTYRGHVQNGVVVFDDSVALPDGMEVRVEPIPPLAKSLADQFADVIGKATDLPPDMAEQHDHYVHGAAKR
ncbi:MAG TPA: hypothetical protein VGY55_07025 [Pirellulales bacterium]|jgi:hypothetical protein|nr:hypothetical protein [Pirellulales bacterium]